MTPRLLRAPQHRIARQRYPQGVVACIAWVLYN